MARGVLRPRIGVGGRREERGAVAIIVAVASSMLVLVAAFCVDLGMQRVVRADMQSVADTAALDMVRQLDAVAPGSSAWRTALRDSLTRNGSTLGRAPAVSPGSGWVCTAKVCATATAGWADADHVFTTTAPAAGAPYTAVKVETTADVDFALATGRNGAVRSAVARSEGNACFKIGSYAARLNTSSSPILGALLGSLNPGITLSAVDYNGLANAAVDVVGLLQTQLAAGTLQQLAATDIRLADLMIATADALGRESGPDADPGDAASATLLRALALRVGEAKLKLGSILDVAGGAFGLDSEVNVYDLLSAAVIAANGANAITVPGTVNLGPVANVQTKVSIIEPPKVGCGRKGRAQATSNQVGVRLNGSLANLALGNLGQVCAPLVGCTQLGLLTTSVSLHDGSADADDFAVKLAAAKGVLKDIRCTPDGITVTVSDGLLAVDLELEVNVKLAGIPVLRGPIKISGQSPTSGDVTIDITDDHYELPGSIGDGSSGLPELHTDTSALQVLGLPAGVGLDAVLRPLLDVLVNPVLQGLDTLILSTLLSSLGVDLTGADVFALRRTTCDNPQLVD